MKLFGQAAYPAILSILLCYCAEAATTAVKPTAAKPATAKPAAAAKIPDALKNDFADVCLHAYLQSSPGAQVMGKRLCECTARETSLQGVRPENLKQETAKIRQNPKYQIHDKALLAAVQICFIDIYSQEVRQNMKTANAASKAKAKAERASLKNQRNQR